MRYISGLPKNSYDIIYLDPPWGGTDYRDTKSLQLYLCNVPVPEIVQTIINKKIAKWLFLKVPNNYIIESIQKFNPVRHEVDSPYRAKDPKQRGKKEPDYLIFSINCGTKKSTKKKSVKKTIG